MGIVELLLLAVGLSMDAFAAAVCKGLEIGRAEIRGTLTVGLWFGAFQGLMPALGFLLGSTFASYIESFDHWIAFTLLGAIGVNTIREALSKDKEEKRDGSERSPLSFPTMLLLAVATSIDALAVGVTFAFLDLNVWAACALIGVTTFALSCAGVKIGSVFGLKHKAKAELAGGIILILLGTKILLEHLGFINF